MAILRSMKSWGKGKKPASNPDLSRQGSPPTQQPSSHPGLVPIDEVDQLQATFRILSLEQELDTSEGHILQLRNNNKRLEAQAAVDHQIRRDSETSYQEILSMLTRRVNLLETEAHDVQKAIDKAEWEQDAFKAECERLQMHVQTVEDENKHFRLWGVRVAETQKQMTSVEEKIKEVEGRNTWLVDNASKEAKELYEEKVQHAEGEAKMKKWLAEKEETQKQEISRLAAELSSQITECEEQTERAKRAEGDVAARTCELQKMHEEVETLGAGLNTREAKIAELVSEKADQRKLLGRNITPRLMLALKLLESKFQSDKHDAGAGVQQFVQSFSTRLLATGTLDVPLNVNEALRFAQNVSQDAALCEALSLSVCAVCRKPKFSSPSQTSEYPTANNGLSICCQKPVCSACLRVCFIASVSWGWWQRLGSPSWISCPVKGCDKGPNIHYLGQLAGALRSVGIKARKVDDLTSKFEKVLLFRKALSMVSPTPSEEALDIARRLHEQLIAVGRMKSLFDPYFDTMEPDEEGKLPPFNPGKIKLGDVEVRDGEGRTKIVSVPIFMRFFNRQRIDCAVCSETFLEIDYGENFISWKEYCDGFPGPWMWDILHFPVGLTVDCEPIHDADTCRQCVRTHLKIQLDQYGRDHCDKLSCPTQDCKRTLTHHDVRMLADKETFEKYDHYKFLNTISADPNFRWCLGDGCDSGQCYQDNMIDPHIKCEACDFDMCFNHQVPWHGGLTCEQYDSERSDDFVKSAQWISENSKKCPGEACGVDIIKGESCFHMTCSQCSFEFCWVCLADWSKIQPVPTHYQRDAHNEGCWFRDNNVRPTQVFGEEVEAAAARRRRERIDEAGR
ncbi:hypothetical protein MKZ38_010644 [Zalerion maritima]|uniref:RBR-type E3 ubiquitin transferase n=1 Tax=Zalerion maritima TaxID=339359 RepID=A0AAD5RS16_9PEZI|nr:hypothetical protein MKZ38_010644 [Zalerion maritima]